MIIRLLLVSLSPKLYSHLNIGSAPGGIYDLFVKVTAIPSQAGGEEKRATGKQTKRHCLQGINERVTAMGGILEISARPGRGVRVKVVLVLGSSNHDVSHDIHKCIADLREMRVESPEFKKIQAH